MCGAVFNWPAEQGWLPVEDDRGGRARARDLVLCMCARLCLRRSGSTIKVTSVRDTGRPVSLLGTFLVREEVGGGSADRQLRRTLHLIGRICGAGAAANRPPGDSRPFRWARRRSASPGCWHWEEAPAGGRIGGTLLARALAGAASVPSGTVRGFSWRFPICVIRGRSVELTPLCFARVET